MLRVHKINQIAEWMNTKKCKFGCVRLNGYDRDLSSKKFKRQYGYPDSYL